VLAERTKFDVPSWSRGRHTWNSKRLINPFIIIRSMGLGRPRNKPGGWNLHACLHACGCDVRTRINACTRLLGIGWTRTHAHTRTTSGRSTKVV